MLMRTTVQTASNQTLARGSQPVPGTPPLAGAIEMMGASMAFGRNAEIFGEGEPADYLYKVLSGTVRTSKILADGRRQIGSFYMTGDIFGLEVGTEHAFSAEAITDAQILVVRRSALLGLAARDGDIGRQLWTLAGHELARVQDHMMLLVRSAQERVVCFLLEMAHRVSNGNTVELTMSRQDIADYLGLTIETVSRTLTALENEGAIELPTSRCITLRKRAVLARLNA